jgi:hypothetical protein
MPRACRFKFDGANQSQLLRRGNELLTGVPFDLNGPLTIAEPMKITSFNINDISRRSTNLLTWLGAPAELELSATWALVYHLLPLYRGSSSRDARPARVCVRQ